MSRHAVFYSRMRSGMGRNMQCYCERFGVWHIDVICSSKQWKLQADIDMDIRAGMIRELIMIRDGLWRFSEDVFVSEDMHALHCLCRLILFFIFFLLMCVLRVRFL